LGGTYNQLHEQTSFIITTNKNPKEWAEMLGDEVLATALLVRLLYKCEVIKLTGKSYRLEHRTTIFEQQQPAEGGTTRKNIATIASKNRSRLCRNDVI